MPVVHINDFSVLQFCNFCLNSRAAGLGDEMLVGVLRGAQHSHQHFIAGLSNALI